MTSEENLKAYEIGYLARDESGRENILNHLKRFRAEILFESDVRSIKLTYPISHLTNAYFGYIHFKLDPESISNLSNGLKLENQIIRFLIITPPFKEKDQRPERPGGEPRVRVEPRASAPIADTSEVAASNDLLEEKLEEILNK